MFIYTLFFLISHAGSSRIGISPAWIIPSRIGISRGDAHVPPFARIRSGVAGRRRLAAGRVVRPPAPNTHNGSLLLTTSKTKIQVGKDPSRKESRVDGAQVEAG